MRSYKTEIYLNEDQENKFKQTVGVCRFVYNFFIAKNKEIYANGGKFLSGHAFSKWLNNEFIPNNSEYSWIKDVYAKSVKQSIMNADQSFRYFFRGLSKYPRFKKKNRHNVKMYFVRTDAKRIIPCERHRIKIPTLGWVRIKEKGYLPTKAIIRSGTISRKANRYYISVLVDEDFTPSVGQCTGEGFGIDLGIKEFATLSNHSKPILNINKTHKVKKLEKSLKRQQRILSRKYTHSGGLSHTRQNLQKQTVKVQKLYRRLSNIRENHINQSVNKLIKQKPSFIVIEDLDIKGMLSNRYLAGSISKAGFYQFRVKLKRKCQVNGIELRVVDRFYPSSKICSSCGFKKLNLKLSDRVYDCEACGSHLDRDLNAALNLKNAKIYNLA